MKFNRRLLLSALVPALLFLAALAVSLVGQSRTQAEFRQLTAREQTLALGYAELYADGLQMGQALRNIILDSRNPTAFKNLKSAREAYDAAHAQLSTVAAGTPFEAPTRDLAPLRARQATAQDEVLQVATTDQAAAIATLNAKETPAWRALRGQLMTLGEQARHDAARRLDEVRRDAARIESLSLVLAALAACVAGAFLWDAQRTVRRELGGDPRDAGLALRRIARGDLATDVPVAPPQSLMAELSDMQQALRRLVGRVRESSESILMASTEVATGSTDLSARTEQAASNLQETAASMEQVTSSVKSSADAARTADQLASGAADTAARGAAVVDDVVRTMERISTGSRRIGDIIGVIDGIAFQTNILALNAAVEAARAGEQGRGFAVVAGEVRTLAKRSADAAREIKSLITASVEQVEAGTQLVATAGSSMSDILAAVRRVTDVVGEITSASLEQSAGVQQIGVAVARLDDMTQQNAALVEESAASAESLKEQAGGLATLVREFQLPRA